MHAHAGKERVKFWTGRDGLFIDVRRSEDRGNGSNKTADLRSADFKCMPNHLCCMEVLIRAEIFVILVFVIPIAQYSGNEPYRV